MAPIHPADTRTVLPLTVDAVCEGLEDDDDKKDAPQHVRDINRQSKLFQKRKHEQTAATDNGTKHYTKANAKATNTGRCIDSGADVIEQVAAGRRLPGTQGCSMTKAKTWHHRSLQDIPQLNFTNRPQSSSRVGVTATLPEGAMGCAL
eukprot:3157437-Amphidinium_carterae.1